MDLDNNVASLSNDSSAKMNDAENHAVVSEESEAQFAYPQLPSRMQNQQSQPKQQVADHNNSETNSWEEESFDTSVVGTDNVVPAETLQVPFLESTRIASTPCDVKSRPSFGDNDISQVQTALVDFSGESKLPEEDLAVGLESQEKLATVSLDLSLPVPDQTTDSEIFQSQGEVSAANGELTETGSSNATGNKTDETKSLFNAGFLSEGSPSRKDLTTESLELSFPATGQSTDGELSQSQDKADEANSEKMETNSPNTANMELVETGSSNAAKCKADGTEKQLSEICPSQTGGGAKTTEPVEDVSADKQAVRSSVEPTIGSAEKMLKAEELNSHSGKPSESAVRVEQVNELATAPTQTAPVTSDVPVLPNTVTQLISPNGVKVYLVGTAHFSLESQKDVAMTIAVAQPHVVMVELCRSRLNILHMDEEAILKEAKDINMTKMRETIRQHGAVQGALYLLFLSTSAHLTRQLGMAPGGEFRRAYNEARNVQGCTIHLGDRPIHVTLQRALGALSLWQKVKLVWHLLMSRESISPEEVEKCKQQDLLEELLKEMTGEFPALSRVFVQERDLCLAHSLQIATAAALEQQRMRQDTRPATVVAVVGIGHVSGMINYFGKVRESEVREVMMVPPPSRAGKIVVGVLKYGVIGLVCYGAYKVLPLPRVASLWK